MLNKIAEFILQERLRELESRINELENSIKQINGLRLTRIDVGSHDKGGMKTCLLYGYIREDDSNVIVI